MIQERILKYLEEKKITPYRFCKDLGLSMGFLNKRGAIGTDKYLKIIEFYNDINPIWLLKGSGKMLLEADKEINKLSIESSNIKRILEIQKLDTGDQARILDALDALIRDAKNRERKG